MANPWVFDVSSLMVLVGEGEEERLRASRRSIIEILVLLPVAGIQSYLKSFDRIADNSKLTYFSPLGRKSAPLRNMELDTTITHLDLLHNGKYSVLETTQSDQKSKYQLVAVVWTMFTWLAFGGLMAFCRCAPDHTWIGITNCVILTGWSVVLRVVGFFIAKDHERAGEGAEADLDLETGSAEPEACNGEDPPNQAKPDFDAVIIQWKRAAAIVIQGRRQDIKLWTTAKLEYDEGLTFHLPNKWWQYFTRCGTLLVLLHIFVTVPNGTTYDQLDFVILTILAQINAFLGLHLNAKACKARLRVLTEKDDIKNRTQMYGYLLRHFRDLDQKWVDQSGMLPKTDIWDKWKVEVIRDDKLEIDPKVLYDRIEKQHKSMAEATKMM